MRHAARLRSIRRGRTCPQVYENRKFYDHFQEVVHRCRAVDKVLGMGVGVNFYERQWMRRGRSAIANLILGFRHREHLPYAK